jgi:hypothetical protein
MSRTTSTIVLAGVIFLCFCITVHSGVDNAIQWGGDNYFEGNAEVESTFWANTIIADGLSVDGAIAMSGDLTIDGLINGNTISTTTGATVDFLAGVLGLLVGSDANRTDFSDTLAIISKDDTGSTSSEEHGLIVESQNQAIEGIAITSATQNATGILGVAVVHSATTSQQAIGTYGQAVGTHSSGPGGTNIGIWSQAANGLLNYSFYGEDGLFYNADGASLDSTLVVGSTLTLSGGLIIGATSVTTTGAEINWLDSIGTTGFTLADAGTVHDRIGEIAAFGGNTIDIDKLYVMGGCSVNGNAYFSTNGIDIHRPSGSTSDVDICSVLTGATVTHKMHYDHSQQRFQFSNHVRVEGNMAADDAVTATDVRVTGHLGTSADSLLIEVDQDGGSAGNISVDVRDDETVVLSIDQSGSTVILTGDQGDFELDAAAGSNIVFGSTLKAVDGETMTIQGNSVEWVNQSGVGAWVKHDHVRANGMATYATGGTKEIVGTNFGSWKLDAVSEYLYFNTSVAATCWDGSTVWVVANVSLSGAETANDIINATLVHTSCGDHEDIDADCATESRDIGHDIEAHAASGDMHMLTFNLTPANIAAEDTIGFRFYLDDVTTGAVVTAVNVHAFLIHYRSRCVSDERFVSIPAQG